MRDAIDVGDHGAQLELLEAAIKVRARQGDGPGVVEAVRSAVALTSVTGEPYRAIEVLTSAVGVLQELGLDDEVAALKAQIARVVFGAAVPVLQVNSRNWSGALVHSRRPTPESSCTRPLKSGT